MKRNQLYYYYMIIIFFGLIGDFLLGGPYFSPFLTLLLCVFLIRERGRGCTMRTWDLSSPFENWYNLSERDIVQSYLSSLELNGERKALAVLIRTEIPESYYSPAGNRYPLIAVREEIASRLNKLIRKVDFIGKKGGAEFLVILEAIDGQNTAGILARRLIKTLAGDFHYKGNTYPVNVNLGITSVEKGNQSSEVMSRCRTALTDAAGLGVNTFVISGMHDSDDQNRGSKLEMALKEALNNDEMEVFLQPKCSAGTGELVSMEALLRWNHPVLGHISPQEFIPVAENSGMIGSISRFVYYRAFQMLEELSRLGYSRLRLSLNVSPLEIHDGSLVGNLTNGLLFTGVDPRKVELEITEGSLLINSETARNILDEVRSLGFQISIDDFGTGYSTFLYLKNFRFDTLKIDKSFIDHIERDNSSRAIVQAIIALSRSLKLQTVAEGVENFEQYEILKELGCDELQGYYFGRPMDFDDFLLYLEDRAGDSISILPLSAR
ncbi:MAG: EAL domain-containing protein [Spirochaetales bacterium]|nr:EAL domain-containing protein [Spirochaetales bacterium]